MKKGLILSILFFAVTISFHAQNIIYRTNSSLIKFNAAKSSIEPIKAENKQVKVILNSSTGEIACLMNMINFDFSNKLMQEHFNENYIESDQFPTGTFQGKIENFTNIDFSTEKALKTTGTFKIHGKKHKKTVILKILKKGETYTIKSDFKLQLKDFKIKIPSIMFYKIAEEVEVSLLSELKQ